MIEKYFQEIDRTVSYFRIIQSYSLNKKVYNDKQGYIKGRLIFSDNSQLEFAEVKNTDIKDKIMYRYHYMNAESKLIFRYDNAKHHKEIKTYPYHKHEKGKVKDSRELSLFEVLIEIRQILGKKQGSEN